MNIEKRSMIIKTSKKFKDIFKKPEELLSSANLIKYYILTKHEDIVF